MTAELSSRAEPPLPGAPVAAAPTGTIDTARILDELRAETTRDDGHLAVLRTLGATSCMAVPLVGLGEILRAVTMVSAGSGRIFGPEDLALVENLAARAATVVAKERRNDSQRRLSHTLQASLRPTEPPALDGPEVAVRYLPGTRGVETGGDFWDVAGLADGTVALAVGDVEGHEMALDAAGHAADLSADALADHILTARTGPDRHDDIAVLVARRSIPVGRADRRGPGSV